MKIKPRGVLCIIFTLLFGVNTWVQAQISTTTYNDREVKRNSIIVVYDDGSVSVKGKAVSPTALASELQTDLGARVETVLPGQLAEEWIINTDMKSTLRQLNDLPGVRAFPNYVFQRDDLKPRQITESSGGIRITEEEHGIDFKSPAPDNIRSSIPVMGMNSYSELNTIYYETFDDSLAIDSTWFSLNYAGGGSDWEITLKDVADYNYQVVNDTDSAEYVSTELFAPGIDMSGLDTTKSYRLRVEITNDTSIEKFYGMYYEGNQIPGSWSNISQASNWLYVDVTNFVGDTLYTRFYTEAFDVPAGQYLVSVDTMYVEEYPVDDWYIEVQWALYNDGLFQFGYSKPDADIDGFEAWEHSTGSSDAVVVVYDDGVDFNHPDLVNNAWVNPGEIAGNGVDDDGNGYVDDVHGWSPVYNNNWFINPGSFHGTHVAGIIGAEGNNGMGVTGVAHDVSMISVMIFDEWGTTDAISIMSGYSYISTLLEQGVNIVAVNQSWGGGGYLDYESDQQFVDVMTGFAWDHASYGTAWVVSAGNSASNRDEMPFYSYPNNIQAPNVITVASTDDADNLSAFSDFGVRTTDIGAPGSFIASTFPNNGYAYLSGTSMAAPQVTGAIALGKSLYPDEDGMDLMVRALAGADILTNLQGVVGEGGRLNADQALMHADAGLIASHTVASFHRTLIDGEGYTTIGFINNSGADVNVSDITITGTDAGSFFAPADFAAEVVPAGGAFSIPIAFDNAGVYSELTATATIVTDGGDVAIELNGAEQGFSDTEITPELTVIGGVPHGMEINTSFTVTNNGTADLNIYLDQFLWEMGLEATEEMSEVINFKPSDLVVEKPSEKDRREMLKEARFLMDESLNEVNTPTIEWDGDGNTAVMFGDDFENADSTNTWWDIQNYGGNTTWSVTPTSETNNVLLWGDFENGYMNNSIAVAWSPVFDLSTLGDNRFAYIVVDMQSSMEYCCDDFWIDAWIGGQGGEVVNLFATWFEPDFKDNQYRTLYLDLSQFTGVEQLQLAVAAQSDGGVVGGFGTMIDNFYLLSEDVPFFPSVTEATIAPGSSQEVDVTVKTGLLPPGDFELGTVLFTNEAFSFYDPFLPVHWTTFESRHVNLEIEPQYQDLGEVGNDAPVTYNFDAKNVGTVGVDFYARNFFSYYNPMPWWGDDSDPFGTSKTDALERFDEDNDKTSVPSDIMAQKEYILGKKAEVELGTADPSDINGSVMNPALQSHVSYFEDFEGGVLPADWEALDYSFGLGSGFTVQNIGSEEEPYNVLLNGEYDPNSGYAYIRDNTRSLIFSPYVDISNTPTSEGLILRFDYSFLLEPEFDVASVWIGYTQGEDEYLFYLGSSEDIFRNDGGEYQAGFSFQDLTQDDTFYVAFLVETDASVQSGWAYFDDIEVTSFDRFSYVDVERGTIDSAATQTFEVTVNTPGLYPGYYENVTFIDYYSEELFIGRGDAQYTSYSIPNQAPVAMDDTIAVKAGDVISLDDLKVTILANDSDDFNFWLHDAMDPTYGDFKYAGEDSDGNYVAPLNYDGVDSFDYVIFDGMELDTATVTIMVMENPSFVTGSDKQYVFLEDDSLTIGTIGMAAGVGGLDQDLIVWGESASESVTIAHDGENNTITFKGAENFFGQITATLHVGYEGMDPMDSMELSVVVIPVNDAPVAEFSITAESNPVNFTDASSDPLDLTDGGIVAWEWDFGDGNTSSERNPTHFYEEQGDYTVTLTVTDNGGLTATTSQMLPITVTTETDDKPLSYGLNQNYPNPFNPSTTISYSIPEISQVSIVVYDLLGQKIAELVNGRQSAGEYSVSFDASRLSSGIYIYRIKAGSFTETKRMTLIK